jgi:nitrite reductase (NO-forming)
MIPAGGAVIAEFKVEVPGTLVMVDHSIFRAFNKGALGMIKVEGEENESIFAGKLMEGIYLPEGGTIQQMPRVNKEEESTIAKTVEQSVSDGGAVFSRTCVACHQSEGQGVTGIFPPLAKSDYMNKDVNRTIDVVLFGLSGEITVNGEKYNSVMTSQNLSDQEVADVLTYAYNSWGNKGSVVTPDMVKARRSR